MKDVLLYSMVNGLSALLVVMNPSRAAAEASGAADTGGLTPRRSPEEAPAGMVPVPAGVYVPLFKTSGTAATVEVQAFYLDVYPVTNAQFLEFVSANPSWRRSQAKRVFAETSYLRHWGGDLDLGP